MYNPYDSQTVDACNNLCADDPCPNIEFGSAHAQEIVLEAELKAFSHRSL